MSTVVASNLFAQQTAQPRSQHLVEFKAGKMNKENTMVRPDLRKGLVYLTKSDDSLLHFCWKDRKSGAVEDDLIVFPEEAEWVKVSQSANGRVYVLKFKSSSQRLFFWMQEPKADKDDELYKKVNAALGQHPQSADAADGASEQHQLMQLLQNQGLLEPFQAASGQSNATAAATLPSTLLSALTPDLLAPVIADPAMRAQLLPLLPENHAHTQEELASVIRSPQFQQAVEALDSALQSGALAPLLQELGLDPSIAVASGDRVLLLLRAIKGRKTSNKMETD